MDRTNLKNKMKRITDNQLYIQIYQVLKLDPSFKPSVNKNGIYYDMVPLDETTIETINELLNNDIQPDVKNKLSYNSYFTETYSNKLQKELYKLKH